MSVKSIITKQSDFTGEFPYSDSLDGLWRFNDSVSSDYYVLDSSKHGRKMRIVNYEGTTATLRNGQKGKFVRINTNNPATEKSYLHVKNDGSIFENIGETIICGGWINPTTYSVGTTYVPIFNTRQGPGQPIFYISLIRGKPRIMLYNAAGSLILDKSFTPTFSFVNGGWYFIACVIEQTAKKAQMILGDRASGECWISSVETIAGELNKSCTADLVFGMHSNSYWWAGGFDDWFLDCDSELTIEDLKSYFLSSLCANGGDTTSSVDAITEPDCVMLRKNGSEYPKEGIVTTAATECMLSGNGRISVTSEYTAGITAISKVETSTSDDLVTWTDWQEIGPGGELKSPNLNYIKFQITLTSSSSAVSPKLIEIQLNEIAKSPYQRLGFARPLVLDANGAWEGVLENAYDVIVTSEVNGADILEFKLPFQDPKRELLTSEKQIQIVDDIYRVRTITDTKDTDGSIVTEVYAEALFYDLAFSVEKSAIDFNAETAEVPLAYALQDTDWQVGTVNVNTKRSWKCTEKNALAILRKTQTIHGGDLVFDCTNKTVNLLTFSGSNSGVLFCYRKNMKSIQRVVDTRSLITRLYAYGSDGMTFASVNDGKAYVEDTSFTKEIRINTLDCSSFTNPYQMLEYAKMRLADYSAPRISYVLSAMDLSVLTGYEHEVWNLGDIVTVVDKELKLSVETRVVRREYNLQEPWNTMLELSTTLRELGDSTSQWDSAADTLAASNLLDSQDVKDLVPFNHLRNSRADNNFAYWVNSGFEVDTENGCSGTASFKCSGVAGKTLSLAQTVTPTNRDTYTISAQIASENLKKGNKGQVGIEVVIEYEDGTTETRFIDLY